MCSDRNPNLRGAGLAHELELPAIASKSTCRLNSFTSGARIWVRVRDVGARGPGPWSNVAVKTVP